MGFDHGDMGAETCIGQIYCQLYIKRKDIGMRGCV